MLHISLGVRHADAQPAVAQNCSPQNGLNFICGPVGSEDLVRVPGTRLLIASGLHIGGRGHLYLVDTRSKSVTALDLGLSATVPRPATLASGRPGAPDPEQVSFSGLGLRQDRKGIIRLYAVNN
ncbi:MAG: hypothetical protein KGL21_01865, partial [Alphaproteobacteria bacterium]|nr:hypothetical protein [Alphaproteobacteria bacterium]